MTAWAVLMLCFVVHGGLKGVVEGLRDIADALRDEEDTED